MTRIAVVLKLLNESGMSFIYAVKLQQIIRGLLLFL